MVEMAGIEPASAIGYLTFNDNLMERDRRIELRYTGLEDQRVTATLLPLELWRDRPAPTRHSPP